MSTEELKKALDKFSSGLILYEPITYDENMLLVSIRADCEDVLQMFSVFQKDNLERQKQLMEKEKRIRELEETCKVLSDPKLMVAIRKARKNGSKSSPYEPLEATQ